MLQATAYDMAGKDTLVTHWFIEPSPTSARRYFSVKKYTDKFFSLEGGFIDLRLITTSRKIPGYNLYWLPDSTGNYTGLQHIAKAQVSVLASRLRSGKIAVMITNPAGGPLAFYKPVLYRLLD